MMRDALDKAAEQASRAGQIIRRLRDFVARGVLSSGYALDDAAIMHFENDELRDVMTLTEGKTAYFVEPDASGGETAVRESPLPARLLG